MRRCEALPLSQLGKGIGIAALFLSLVSIAFVRGDYLLGWGYGCLFGFIVAGAVYLFAWPAGQSPGKRRANRLIVVFVAFPLLIVLSFPMMINPTIRPLIEDQRVERAVRSELYGIFGSDIRFAHLTVSTRHLKTINVTISGPIPNKFDLRDLRTRIANEAVHAARCILHWDLVDQHTGEVIRCLDSELRRSKDK